MPQAARTRPSRPPQTASTRALRKNLPQHATWRRTERAAHRQLERAGFRSDEHQVGHVDRRNQQHQRDRRKQQRQHRLRVTHERRLKRIERGSPPFIGHGVLHCQPGRDDVELGLRLWNRNAVAQPSDNRQDVHIAILRKVLNRGEAGKAAITEQPQIDGLLESECRRHDANDLDELIGHGDGAANEVGPPAVAPPPERFAENRLRRATGRIVGRQKRPARDRVHAEHGEKISRHLRARCLLGSPVAGQPHCSSRDRGKAFERGVVAIVEEVGGRQRTPAPVGGPAVEHRRCCRNQHQTLRLGVGQRTQQHGIHRAEDRRRSADAERQRQDCRRRRNRRFQQQPRTKTNIGQELGH